VAAQATFFFACAFSPRKLNSCALTSSACVPGDAVRPAFHDVQASALDHFGGAGADRSDRDNAVFVAVDDERWRLSVLAATALLSGSTLAQIPETSDAD
jgi:hypothetical protein